MEKLSYWLEWDDNAEYGFSGLRGEALRMYVTETGVQEYLSALRSASDEERKHYEAAIFETLYILAANNDKTALEATFSICPWLLEWTIDSELSSPLDSAVECGALEAIDVFIAAGMYDADEAMHIAIDKDAESAVFHLLNYQVDTEKFLSEAIVSTKTIRNAVFEQVRRLGKKVSCAKAVQKALLANAEIEFLRALVDVCADDVFEYCFEDGRCLLDYAKNEQSRDVLMEKGATFGDPNVIQLLSFNRSVYHVVNNVNNHDKLLSVLLSIENVEQALYDMCHMNGEYSSWDDLLYSILNHGGFHLFENILPIIKDYKHISGEIYCAPFGLWVKWTEDDWTAYDRIVRTLIDKGVKVVGNPILKICDCLKYEYEATLHDGIKNLIENILELFYINGVDINQQMSGCYSYSALACALSHSSVVGLEFLLRKGVKIISKKERPLSFCTVSLGYDKPEIPAKVMDALKEAGLDINETDECGDTVLHYICRWRNPSARIFSRALEYGADPSIPDQNGMRPIDIAKEKGLAEIIKCLEV